MRKDYRTENNYAANRSNNNNNDFTYGGGEMEKYFAYSSLNQNNFNQNNFNHSNDGPSEQVDHRGYSNDNRQNDNRNGNFRRTEKRKFDRNTENDYNQKGNDNKRGRDRSNSRNRSKINDNYNNNYRKGDRHPSKEEILLEKESRELFVGNVAAAGVSEEALKDFLNAAMKRVGLVTSESDPILACRMNNKFCFIEFSNPADCTNALNLNGIPFMGSMLKIGRPAKYRGPVTASVTWQQLTGQASLNDPVPDTAIVIDPVSKPYREIFVGNTSPDMTESGIKEFIGGAMQKMGMSNSGSDNPISQVRINGKFSFIELRTIEDASNVLNLNGIPFLGINLKLSRPTKFSGGMNVNYYNWDELYALWTSGELKVMTAGVPSPVVAISNMATMADLADHLLYLDIIEDTRMECSQYGVVKSVIVPRNSLFDINSKGSNSISVGGTSSTTQRGGRPILENLNTVLPSPNSSSSHPNNQNGIGKVFVEMETIDQATKVLLALKGRTFDGRTVDVKFYPLDYFTAMNYSYQSPASVITSTHGATSMDRILQPHVIDRLRLIDMQLSSDAVLPPSDTVIAALAAVSNAANRNGQEYNNQPNHNNNNNNNNFHNQQSDMRHLNQSHQHPNEISRQNQMNRGNQLPTHYQPQSHNPYLPSTSSASHVHPTSSSSSSSQLQNGYHPHTTTTTTTTSHAYAYTNGNPNYNFPSSAAQLSYQDEQQQQRGQIPSNIRQGR